MRTATPFVAISASRPIWSDEINADRNAALKRQLRALPTVSLILETEGKWKGQREESFLVFLPKGDADPAYGDVLRLARRYSQDSILLVDANRQAYLVDPLTKQSETIGKWEEIDGVISEGADHTRTADGRYWRVK